MKERSKLEFPETFKVTSLIESPKQYDVEELIKVIGTKIFDYTNANILVQYNDKILNKFSTEECELQALLDKTPVPHTYNLLLKTKLSDSLSTIICHEMQHFDQCERRDLELVKKDSKLVFLWKGQQFDSSLDYMLRPWEQEAIDAQYSLWKQFKQIYYK